MLTRLYNADVKRTPAMRKLPPMPKTYLYPEARQLFPNLASQSVSSLKQEVTRKYKARRYDVIWLQKASLPVMRYPVGLPIPKQMWRLEREEGKAWLFSCRIGQQRLSLRLRGGPHFHRQVKVLEQVIEGKADAGGATLYQVRSNDGDNRPEAQYRTRLMLRIAVDLPVKTRKIEGVLQVRTSSDALIVAGETGEEWVEHNDHIRRSIIAAMRQQRHLSDDLKAERRRPKREREGMVQRMGNIGHRQGQRMRSYIHEAAAHLVGYAVRRKYEAVAYDDSVRTFCARFPWHELKQRIEEKCNAAGIKFIASAPLVGESPGAFEGE